MHYRERNLNSYLPPFTHTSSPFPYFFITLFSRLPLVSHPFTFPILFHLLNFLPFNSLPIIFLFSFSYLCLPSLSPSFLLSLSLVFSFFIFSFSSLFPLSCLPLLPHLPFLFPSSSAFFFPFLSLHLFSFFFPFPSPFPFSFFKY